MCSHSSPALRSQYQHATLELLKLAPSKPALVALAGEFGLRCAKHKEARWTAAEGIAAAINGMNELPPDTDKLVEVMVPILKNDGDEDVKKALRNGLAAIYKFDREMVAAALGDDKPSEIELSKIDMLA